MFKKLLYGTAGLMIGFFIANAFFIPELLAQYGRWSEANFTEMEMRPLVPNRYGNLVAVYGDKMYFQASDGAVYVVKPRTDTEIEKSVSVVKRSE